MACRLRFLDPNNAKLSMKDAAFDGFCVALRTALPGFHIDFSRVDEQQSYIGRLPW
jgi:hypothetical protein